MTWYQGIIYDLNFTESIEWRRINYSIHPNIKDKFIVENATLGCKLTVTAVQYNDKGSFKCAFQNSSERTAELFVIRKLFLIFRLLYSNNNFKKQEHYVLIAKCYLCCSFRAFVTKAYM